MDIGGWFVGEALQAFLTGMGGTQVGIIGFAAILAVIIATVLMFIKTVLKLITHLADRAPQWIGGHSGQGLGEADIAQGAISNAGSGAGKYGMYAGDKMNAGMDSMNASAKGRADEQERAAASASSAETAERRHQEMMGALSGGKAAGQGQDTPPQASANNDGGEQPT
ncbi:hypothetical protein NR402_03760 [Acidithiobacillus ferrooxidans]|uniref:hypothetical protein n=1 Tax=Acidithiobacillus ferrooxidans TaxID=920 RepID=UPI000B020467|nr:hypothetical protein [Acidithiobacillus ferrooxidans]MCR2829399.1 hypothetical protein [Acidithiobacillus ferrooxidans]